LPVLRAFFQVREKQPVPRQKSTFLDHFTLDLSTAIVRRNGAVYNRLLLPKKTLDIFILF